MTQSITDFESNVPQTKESKMTTYPRKIRIPQVNTKPKHLAQFEDQADFDQAAKTFELANGKMLSSRETYLAWVQEWKIEYKQITKQIRSDKKELRATSWEEDLKKWCALEASLSKSRSQARQMLRDRSVAKVLSWAAKNKDTRLVANA